MTQTYVLRKCYYNKAGGKMNELIPVNNPHDAYFKATFGKIDFAKDFLNNYLPQELISYINIETLSPEPTTYLTKELKEQFTDLI